MPARNAQVEAFAKAIARNENTSSYSSFLRGKNNPGALMYASQYGATPFQVTGRDGKPLGTFAQFGTEQQGWDALYRQIELNAGKGLTLYEFFAGKPGVYYGYAPSGHGGNQPNVYANSVGKWLGIPVTMKVADYLNGNTAAPAPAPAPTPDPIVLPVGNDSEPESWLSSLIPDMDSPDTAAEADSAGIPTPILLGLGAVFAIILAMGFKRG
jgi:hypothetical protein